MRRIRAGLLAAAMTLALVAAWCLIGTTPAHAAGVCSGVGSNYFNGYYQNGKPQYQFTGASSYIVVRDGVNCSGASGTGNFTNAWVMIAGPGLQDWGQVGFERTAGQTLRWFSQFSYDGGLTTRYSTHTVTNQIGVRHAFRVLYYADCRCLRANIDGSVGWFRSSFDPKREWGAQPWSPQFFAETGYLQSDVPGRASTPTAYTALGAQRLSDGRLVGMPCILSAATDNPSRWGRAASSCTAFNVWTK
jgi:hypothetical protein